VPVHDGEKFVNVAKPFGRRQLGLQGRRAGEIEAHNHRTGRLLERISEGLELVPLLLMCPN
jgi:hypothetical protein